MLIFVKPRIVLMSVPKTGTTALEEALAPDAEIAFRAEPWIKHLTLRQYLNRIRPLITRANQPGYETVAVVREPEDWLGSWYRYRSRPALNGHPNSTADVDFDTFVNEYLRPRNRPAYARLGGQAEMLVDHEDRIAVDHIFRYEAMPLFVDFLSQRLARPITLAQRNVSPPGALELSKQTRSKLRRKMARDYEVWQDARH